MTSQVMINGVVLQAEGYRMTKVKGKIKISFQFQVTSEEYHNITSLLYKNDFDVEVPEESLKFHANIHNYSTSITNLYEKNNVGTFYLELIEK